MIISYNPLYFCGIDCNFSFISDLTFLGFSLFFSWQAWLKVYQFCLSVQSQLLDLLILWIVLLVSMSLNSSLIFIISFILLTLGFVCCYSSSSCRCRVRLFIWNVSIFFLGRPVLLWTSLSGLPLLCPIGFGLLCIHFHLFPETFDFFFHLIINPFIVK